MAITWTQSPLISEAFLNNTTYYLKDAEARQKIEDLFDQFVSTAFSFQIFQELPTASATYATTIALIADEDAEAGSYIEYACIGNSTDGYEWEPIGSTKTDLSDYVQKDTTIAGIDLQDNITGAELKQALGLGSMAYVNSASVSGTATITHTQTAAGVTQGKVTAEGSVSTPTITVTPATSSVNIGTVTGVSATTSDIAIGDVTGITTTDASIKFGDVTDVTAQTTDIKIGDVTGVTPTTTTAKIGDVTGVSATTASLAVGKVDSVSAATTVSAAGAGAMQASVSGETLTFTTPSAVTAIASLSVVDAVAQDIATGLTVTKASQDTTIVTDVTANKVADGSETTLATGVTVAHNTTNGVTVLTGASATKNTTTTTLATGVTVTQQANATTIVTGIQSASSSQPTFTGSEVSVVGTAVTYDKADSSASVSGTATP